MQLKLFKVPAKSSMTAINTSPSPIRNEHNYNFEVSVLTSSHGSILTSSEQKNLGHNQPHYIFFRI